jgi:hypothetical protein
VLDLDIKGFFDNIDHDLLMKAVRRHTDCRWALLYIGQPLVNRRWQQLGAISVNCNEAAHLGASWLDCINCLGPRVPCGRPQSPAGS